MWRQSSRTASASEGWQLAHRGVLVALLALVGCVATSASATITSSEPECRPLLSLSDLEPGSDELPEDWSVRTLLLVDKPTVAVLQDDGGRYLRIESHDAAAFAHHTVEPGPETSGVARGILRWSWRSESVIESADIRRAAYDDSPLRVFVGFVTSPSDDPLSDGQAIFYTWGNRGPLPEPFVSHLSERIVVWPLRGPAEVGEGWQMEARDVAADFRTVFGADPPPVTTVGFVSDTDQTGSSVTVGLRDLCLAR